jgi:GNAT superfamily N-acetyltransferase
VIRELGPEQTALAHRAMGELRPAFAGDEAAFVRQVNEVQRAQGYRLFAAFEDGSDAAAAVAGFRRLTFLAWGDVLYIDDLSTHPDARSRGHGSRLLAAVADEAERLGCDAVHLDSGHHRHDAHRLYLATGFRIDAHHFVRPVR